jgi:NnrS protein
MTKASLIHDMDEAMKITGELDEAVENPAAAPVTTQRSIGDTIYRPFFIAGLTTLLTLGCMWGAINLLTIALSQNFSAVKYSWTLAHGHAMVSGFVGFFIMGFAYQAYPRFKHTSLWKPKLAFASLPLMAGGIVLQTVAHLTVPSSASMPLEVIAAAIQLASVIIFALVIVKSARQANKPEVYDRFVYTALGWFVLAAIANPIIFKLFEFPGTREQLLFNLATFNIPYRDVQLIGIAVMMILGGSLRFLPHAYGLREPSKRWRAFLFWGVNAALTVGAISFIAGMAGGNYWLLTLQWLCGVALLIVAIGTPRQFRLFGSVPENERDRGLKFIRAAFVWFIVATAMLVFVPIYNFGIYMPFTGSHVPFSHAFFGAYRHSITVGFIMMMIVGVSSKVVPTLSGVDVRRAASLWPTFILLNVGNAMRVSFQIATDFTPGAYPIMGVSGFIEVVGLTLWAYELVSNMRAGRKLEKQPTKLIGIARPMREKQATP